MKAAAELMKTTAATLFIRSWRSASRPVGRTEAATRGTRTHENHPPHS
jgi:hypothetical protein